MTDCKDCRLDPRVALAATIGTSGGRPPVGLKDEIRVYKTTQSNAPAACSLSYNVYQTSELYVSSELTTAPYETVELTSTLYPLEFMDSLAPSVVAPILRYGTPPMDAMQVGLVAPTVVRKTVVRYLTYTAAEPEALNVGLVAPSIKRENTIIPPKYWVYRDSEPEKLQVGLVAPSISRKKVADRFVYRIPTETITVGLVAPVIKRTNT